VRWPLLRFLSISLLDRPSHLAAPRPWTSQRIQASNLSVQTSVRLKGTRRTTVRLREPRAQEMCFLWRDFGHLRCSYITVTLLRLRFGLTPVNARCYHRPWYAKEGGTIESESLSHSAKSLGNIYFCPFLHCRENVP